MNANGQVPKYSDIATWVVWVWLFAVTIMLLFSSFDLQKAGQMGDMFGVLNSLFTGLGFAGVYLTLRQQSIQLQNQQKEMADREQKDIENRKMATDQLRAMAKQNALVLGERLIEALNGRIQEAYNEIVPLQYIEKPNREVFAQFTESQIQEKLVQCRNGLEDVNSAGLNGVFSPNDTLLRRRLEKNIELWDAILTCKRTLNLANHTLITKANEFFNSM